MDDDAVVDCLLYELKKTVVRGVDYAVHNLLSCLMLLRNKMVLMSGSVKQLK